MLFYLILILSSVLGVKKPEVFCSCFDELQKSSRIYFIPRPLNQDPLNTVNSFFRACLREGMDFQLIFCNLELLLSFIINFLDEDTRTPLRSALLNMSCIIKRDKSNKFIYASPDIIEIREIGKGVECIPLKIALEKSIFGIFRIQHSQYIVIRLNYENDRSIVSIDSRASFPYIKWLAEPQRDISSSLYVKAFTEKLPWRLLAVDKSKFYFCHQFLKAGRQSPFSLSEYII